MGQRKKHVIYKDGNWVVQINGHANSAIRFPTKYDAIKAAAGTNGNDVVIHSKRGQVSHWFEDDPKRSMEILDIVHEIATKPKTKRKSKVAA